jgi:hypothetical protein
MSRSNAVNKLETRLELPSWDRRGGAKRRGGSQVETFPLPAATTPRGIRFAIPLPTYPTNALNHDEFKT